MQIADLRRSRNFKSIRLMSELSFSLTIYADIGGKSAMEITGLLRLRKECTILHVTAYDRERKYLLKASKKL